MQSTEKPTNQSIPQIEAEVLEFWKKHEIFEKSVEKNAAENAYVFYDGPPFISGLPHYGHLLGSIAKDIIPRYWTMQGKRVERVWGWDAHGLTVENKVQSRLGIKNRRDIEAFGLEKFTQESYKYTSEISEEWKWYIDRIGRWVDMDHSYKTIDRTYMESVMWAFKKLYDKGLIYEGIYTSMFCTTCGTPVSHFEVAMDNSYKDVEDPAITVKFPVTTTGKFQGTYLLAWTTTPWTIPSNRALVVHEESEYVIVEFSGDKYVLAGSRLEFVFKDKEYKVLESFKGSELIGLEYDPIYKFYAKKEGEFKVYSFPGMANMEEGTGIVHSAPGFGEIDTEMGRHYGLTIMMSIDEEGKFVPGNLEKNPWEGVYYSKANDPIREDMKNRNLLFGDERVVHRFPYHDRCNTLLIQRAQNSWFVDIKKLKSDLDKNNEGINWIPEHLKEGRFKLGIEQAPDWCISRNRFWATPMPVWESKDGDRIVVSSVSEIEELSGQKVTDLHRPYIDAIVIKKDGKEYFRRPEVLDSWFEAGSMPYAQIHYPFENKERFEKNFPGDFIVEYIAQTRAWFFFMHVLSTALFGCASFKNVISTGVMAGSDGRKMSKTYGNYADPKGIIETIGGDALRLYLMNSPLMVGENANFDEVELRNKSRNVLNPFWNSVKFFDMYASLHGWNSEKLVESTDLLDRWIIARLHETIKTFSENLEKYLVPPAVKSIEEFVDDLSRWYVRRSRDRISSGDPQALSTLYTVLDSFSKTSAPLVPFLSEKIFLTLKQYRSAKENTPESVHLCDFPKYHFSKIDTQVLSNMKVTRDIASLGLAIRSDKNIKVRQPLSTLYVDETFTSKDSFYKELILDEVNVKNIDVVSHDKFEKVSGDSEIKSVYLDPTITNELKLEGLAREMVRQIQDLRKANNLSVSDRISAKYPDSLENNAVVSIHQEDIKKKVLATSLTPSLAYEITKEI